MTFGEWVKRKSEDSSLLHRDHVRLAPKTLDHETVMRWGGGWVHLYMYHPLKTQLHSNDKCTFIVSFSLWAVASWPCFYLPTFNQGRCVDNITFNELFTSLTEEKWWPNTYILFIVPYTESTDSIGPFQPWLVADEGHGVNEITQHATILSPKSFTKSSDVLWANCTLNVNSVK